MGFPLATALVTLCLELSVVLSSDVHLPPRPALQEPDQGPSYYFWNEHTGKVQWDDPGDVPYEDEEGNRYWLDSNDERVDENPGAQQYAWVEGWSSDHGRAFFYNQETKESTWDRPPDLAWRRIPVPHDQSSDEL